MREKPLINIFWFRRDLRLDDNAALYHALRAELPVLPLFIFDTTILEKLPDKDDARVTFIHRAVTRLNNHLSRLGSSLLVKHGTPLAVFEDLLTNYQINAVFANADYEPYARTRDELISTVLNIRLNTYKDHVIFAGAEILKEDSKPYTVFTPYKRKWLERLKPEDHLKAYPTLRYADRFLQGTGFQLPTLDEIGFQAADTEFPPEDLHPGLAQYGQLRDIPAISGTSRVGIHLRFGTLSIREAARFAFATSEVWLSELIWREFYSMVLWHFPETANHAFKREFDHIKWRNNPSEFEAWCKGMTGYPIVDAGMRELNATGWMHNRVRMIVASFLCKHLLIDWRWGEAYFAQKLIDYEMASNVGGWQWAAGTGNDAAPYFRVFNPQLQTEKFDKNLEYIKKWIPEFGDPFKYPLPIVEHKFARERALKAYKEATTSA
jgi:deoxyribodipyrimidine photo-lyase